MRRTPTSFLLSPRSSCLARRLPLPCSTSRWPAERPVPQVSIELDVADAAAVGPAAQELEQAGYELLHPPRKEPWGHTVARLQSPEGAILGISDAPVLHEPE